MFKVPEDARLSRVVSDLTGVTGLAILAGERDPQKPAALRDRRVKASEATITKALVGDCRHPLCHSIAVR